MFGEELQGTIRSGSRSMDGFTGSNVRRVSGEAGVLEHSRCRGGGVGVDGALHTSLADHNKEEILKDRVLFEDGAYDSDYLTVSYFGCLELHF